MTTNRQLAAIMFTDIIGYTALMESDETKALSVLKVSRKIHKNVIKKFNCNWLKERRDVEEVKAITKDLVGNEEKINHHGKRAELIAKGMLLHSRGSSGQKEPTDINALCDEYLHLSYHGFRAKDKSFNVDFRLKADITLPKINVVPQDIGRGLLNLINNAFYIIDKKAKENPKDYKPEYVVSTRNYNDIIEIRVIDNGSGIPEEIKSKIFHPFFTAKPTRQGTGLELSLSYDIVKVHGGEIKVESKKKDGTKLIIILLF